MGKYICPVCRASRDVDLSDYISWKTHSKILLSVTFFTTTAYLLRGPALAFKLSLLYLPIWAISEFLHWTRIRKESQCPQCHFDPILYQRNWKEARERVETRLNAIKSSAEKIRAEKAARFLGKEPIEQQAEENEDSESKKALESLGEAKQNKLDIKA